MIANGKGECGAAPGIEGKSPQPPYGFRIAIALVIASAARTWNEKPPEKIGTGCLGAQGITKEKFKREKGKTFTICYLDKELNFHQ